MYVVTELGGDTAHQCRIWRGGRRAEPLVRKMQLTIQSNENT